MDDICRGSISISFEDAIVMTVGGKMPAPRTSVRKCFGSRLMGSHQGAELSKCRSTKPVWEARCQHHECPVKEEPMKPPQGAELSKMPQHTIEVGIGRKPKLFFFRCRTQRVCCSPLHPAPYGPEDPSRRPSNRSDRIH